MNILTIKSAGNLSFFQFYPLPDHDVIFLKSTTVIREFKELLACLICGVGVLIDSKLTNNKFSNN